MGGGGTNDSIIAFFLLFNTTRHVDSDEEVHEGHALNHQEHGSVQ